MSAKDQKNLLKGVYLVPGMPHLAQTTSAPHQPLVSAMAQVRDEMMRDGVERVVYYSTQWISVLGHSVQGRQSLRGRHVDENWHELGALEFSLTVDRALAERITAQIAARGMAAALVDYEGFPVDTGTIVASRLAAPEQSEAAIVSCSVYANHDETRRLGEAVAEALKAEPRPTAVVGVSLLSGRFFTSEIDLAEDRVREPSDDQWNRRILAALEQGKLSEVHGWLDAFAAEAKADMGLKALSFLEGVNPRAAQGSGRVLGYGPLYGAGAAVVAWHS